MAYQAEERINQRDKVYVKKTTITNTGSSVMPWSTYLTKIGEVIKHILTVEVNTSENQNKVLEIIQISEIPVIIAGKRYTIGASDHSRLSGIRYSYSTTARYDELITCYDDLTNVHTITTFSGTAVQYSDQSSNAALNAGSSKNLNIFYRIYDVETA